MNLTSVRHNPNFYLEDLFFLVDKSRFKVYAFYFLEHSAKIRSIIGHKPFDGHVHLGMNWQCPITLENIREIDFELFLELVYPVSFSYSTTITRKSRTVNFWLSIMKVATELEIKDLQKLCISSIRPLVTKMTPINKFQLAHKIVDVELLIEALCGLVSDVGLLAPGEAKILGFETLYRIMQIREIWCLNYRSANKSQYTVHEHNTSLLHSTVRWEFRAQLRALGLTIEENDQKSPKLLEGYPTSFPDILFPNEKGEVKTGHLGDGYTSEFPLLSNFYAWFYRDPKSIIFQVEGELFKVHLRYFHENSSVFRDMLKFNSNSSEGTTDENPIHLHGIKAKDFETFLLLLTSNLGLKTVNLKYDDWRSVLELSTLWCMRSLREICTTHMSPLPALMTPLEKALMARKYMVGDWLVDAFEELIRRDTILTDEEADQLDLTTAFKLLQIQVKWLKKIDREQTLKKAIRDAFQKELQRFKEYDLDSE